jgi:hypothetical protein
LPGVWGGAIGLPLAFCAEILGRYLFFVSVVPKNMAASYLTPKQESA